MKVAIVGSRKLTWWNFASVLPPGVTEIISGGAKGIDECAWYYAQREGIPLTEFLPNYRRYGSRAPLVRNRLIVEAADFVLAIWDGFSTGTMYTLRYAVRCGKPFACYRLVGDEAVLVKKEDLPFW